MFCDDEVRYARGQPLGRTCRRLVFGNAALTNMASSSISGRLHAHCHVDINGDGLDDGVAVDGLILAPFTDNQPDVALSLRVCDDAGDMNGDGYDDLLAGERSYTYSSYTPGAAYLLFGALSLGPSPAWDVRFSGYSSSYDGDEIGASVSTAGDTNADGTPDLLVGSPGDTKGAAYLFYGPVTAHTAVGNADFTVVGTSNGDGLGSWVVGGWDVSGDGVGDLVIADAGGAYSIIFGGSY